MLLLESALGMLDSDVGAMEEVVEGWQWQSQWACISRSDVSRC